MADDFVPPWETQAAPTVPPAVVNQTLAVEGTGQNPRSSAVGPGQFINSTALDMVKRYRPDVAYGKSDSDILATRTDPSYAPMWRDMTNAYAAENSEKLSAAGFQPSAGNIYLSHFLGPGGAMRVLGSDPTTPVSQLLDPGAIRANPQIANMTAGDIQSWAAGKMRINVGRGPQQGTPAAQPSAQSAGYVPPWETPGASVTSSLPAAISDIPTEIAAAFNAGKQQFLANQPFSQFKPNFHEGATPTPSDVSGNLTAPAAAAGGLAEMVASPITGTVRSLLGHPIADVTQALGGRLDANVTGPPETPEQAYQEAKSKADTAMLLAGVANRVPRTAYTPQLSGPAQTAEALGAPLPKGLASESPAINATTAATASVPIFGSRINAALDATREAAGNAIGQSGVDAAIAANRKTINNLYNGVRNSIDPDQVMPMPQTAGAVAAVKARRAAARQENPSQGLEQFENIGAQGASFNGAHRARVDAREAGDALNPHPGYNAADYNQITQAMTGDIRVNVARQGGQAALDSFDQAERNFGPISEANRFLSRIARQRGPGAGLDELGFNPATGEFSLNKFVTAWNKINPEARRFVPEAAHRQNIEDIFQMGQHIKGSMGERNTSHTSNVLILWDLARDSIMTGAAVAAGYVSGASLGASGAAAAPAVLFMHWLSKPATAASMARWSRAYRAVTSTPANAPRLAQFNIASRNLANNLGVNVGSIMQSVQRYLPVPAQEQQQQQPRVQ